MVGLLFEICIVDASIFMTAIGWFFPVVGWGWLVVVVSV